MILNLAKFRLIKSFQPTKPLRLWRLDRPGRSLSDAPRAPAAFHKTFFELSYLEELCRRERPSFGARLDRPGARPVGPLAVLHVRHSPVPFRHGAGDTSCNCKDRRCESCLRP